MASPNKSWNKLFSNLNQQGQQFDNPQPPDEDTLEYFGFLAKADQDWETKKWDILFEVASDKWMNNAIFFPDEKLPNQPKTVTPKAPALRFHLVDCDEQALLTALNLKSATDIIEGDWYQLTLVKGDGKSPSGELYDVSPEDS